MVNGSQIVVAKAARTAAGNTDPLFGFGEAEQLRVQVDVDAVAGTTPSLVVIVEDSIDGGENWNAVDTFPAATAAGVTVRTVTTTFSDLLRVRWTITGTTPSVTFGVALYAE